MLYGKYTGSIYVELLGQSQKKGEEKILHLRYENRGFLPIAAACVVLEWEAPCEALCVSKYWIREIAGGKTADCEVALCAAHCGRAVIRIRKVRIYDYIGLCAINKKSGDEKGIYITPEVKELTVNQNKASYIKDVGGNDDIKEDYEVRGYRAGDSIQRIHWKLTARTDELQIRDFNGKQTDAVVLYLNLCSLKKDMQGADTWDKYLELAVGLMLSLYGGGRLDRVIWLQSGQNALQEIKRREDIFECMYRLLALDISQMGGKMQLTDGLHLDMDLRIYQGAQCIYG